MSAPCNRPSHFLSIFGGHISTRQSTCDTMSAENRNAMRHRIRDVPVNPVAPRMTMSYFLLRTSDECERGGEGEEELAMGDVAGCRVPATFLYRRERRSSGTSTRTAKGNTHTRYNTNNTNAHTGKEEHINQSFSPLSLSLCLSLSLDLYHIVSSPN